MARSTNLTLSVNKKHKNDVPSTNAPPKNCPLEKTHAKTDGRF